MSDEYEEILGIRFYKGGYTPKGTMMAVNTDYPASQKFGQKKAKKKKRAKRKFRVTE